MQLTSEAGGRAELGRFKEIYSRIKMSICKYCSKEFNSEKMLERHYNSCKDKLYHDQIEQLKQQHEKELEKLVKTHEKIVQDNERKIKDLEYAQTQTQTQAEKRPYRIDLLVDKYEKIIADLTKEKKQIESKCSEYEVTITNLQKNHKQEIELLKNESQVIEQMESYKQQLENEKSKFQQALAYVYRENEKRFKNVRKQMLILKTFVEGKITLIIDEESLLKLNVIDANNSNNNDDININNDNDIII